jgi:hypothetical protein
VVKEVSWIFKIRNTLGQKTFPVKNNLVSKERVYRLKNQQEFKKWLKNQKSKYCRTEFPFFFLCGTVKKWSDKSLKQPHTKRSIFVEESEQKRLTGIYRLIYICCEMRE